MTPFTFLLVSSAVFSVLALWFSFEERKGARLASGVRVKLDQAVTSAQVSLDRMATRFGSGSLLTLTYWSFHSLLTGARAGLTHMLEWVDRLMRRNLRRAERLELERQTIKSESPLSQIAAHKAATSLTEKQREAKRQAHLEGRI